MYSKEFMEEVLKLAARGWWVLPVNKDKAPIVKHYMAAKDEKAVIELFSKHPGHGVAIITGEKSGVFVLDKDVKIDEKTQISKGGEESLFELEQKFGKLPHTVEAITPSLGGHFYFKYPGFKIETNASKLAPGLDIRGDGGIIVVCPTPGYHWEVSSRPDDVPVSDAPIWLLNLLKKDNGYKAPFKLPSIIPQGEQDDTMFRFACSLKAQGFDEECLRTALRSKLKDCPQNEKDPFTDKDVERWVKQAMSYKDSDNKKILKTQFYQEVADRVRASYPLILSKEMFYLWISNAMGGAYYKEIETQRVHQIIKQTMAKDYSVKAATDVITILKADCYKEIEIFNREHNELLSVLNGMLDLNSLTLRVAMPEDYVTNQLPVVYDKNARCPLWEMTIKDILNENEDDIKIIQEFFGYCLMRGVKEQKCLILYGDGANGKGVVTGVLQNIIGMKNMTTLSLDKFTSRYVGRLNGKMLNIATESSAYTKEWSETFKAAIAGEIMMADEKYRPCFEFIPYAKHIITMNEKPYLEDKSFGVARRIMIIPFEKQYTEKPEHSDEALIDKDLSEKLKEEQSGQLNWSLIGAKRLIENGRFSISERHSALIEEMRIDSNSALSFVKDECEIDHLSSVSVKELYNKYKEYCMESGLKGLIGKKKFNHYITKHYKLEKPFLIGRGNEREWCIHGIKIGISNDEDSDENNQKTSGSYEFV